MAYINRTAFDLLVEVAQDVTNLLTCNCTYTVNTKPGQTCDGSCTHGMAVAALAILAEQDAPVAPVVNTRTDDDVADDLRALRDGGE